MITPVNLHYQKYDFYAGRARSDAKWNLQGSPLGNPFTVSQHGLNAIELYRRWLWKQIKAHNPEVCQALIDILRHERMNGEVRVGCWCKPKPCHVDVIVSALGNAEVLGILAKFVVNKEEVKP